MTPGGKFAELACGIKASFLNLESDTFFLSFKKELRVGLLVTSTGDLLFLGLDFLSSAFDAIRLLITGVWLPS